MSSVAHSSPHLVTLKLYLHCSKSGRKLSATRKQSNRYYAVHTPHNAIISLMNHAAGHDTVRSSALFSGGTNDKAREPHAGNRIPIRFPLQKCARCPDPVSARHQFYLRFPPPEMQMWKNVDKRAAALLTVISRANNAENRDLDRHRRSRP